MPLRSATQFPAAFGWLRDAPFSGKNPEKKAMRIHFERTGGVGGPAMRRAVSVETETLPAAEADELRTLMGAADVPALANQLRTEKGTGRPDEFRYRLVVEDGDQCHTVETSDTSMPAPLHSLVKWLVKHAST